MVVVTAMVFVYAGTTRTQAVSLSPPPTLLSAEAPVEVHVDAAARLGVPTPQVVLAYAWGDMATDIIQPFWALPLLAAARIDFREILGYAALVFVAYNLLVSLGFWLLPMYPGW